METPSGLWRRDPGQILVGVMLILLMLLVAVPAVVVWVQQEARISVKNRKSTTAFNLAQAAVDRGYWKIKSSTGTAAMALAGQVITGYNFDTTYGDVSGGTYRIKLAPAASNSVTITGEGRDNSTKEVRAISAVYQNRTIYSPLLAQGNINYNKGVSIFWGPIMSQGNVNLDATTSQWYFPQKYARADVIGTAANPRDKTWPLPPNTDSVEWWANYQYVPELPKLDFFALRSSATLTNTLNVYGCKNSSYYTNPATGATVAGAAPWDARGSCNESAPHYNPGSAAAAALPCYGASCHFGNNWNHLKSAKNQPNTDYVWFWDGDVTFSGAGGYYNGLDSGIRGTVIVLGNLTIDSGGDYTYTGTVPQNAWQQHKKFTTTLSDGPSSGEYPADIGLNKSTGVWTFGPGSSFCFPTSPPGGTTCGFVNTVGIRGFTYVGGNLIIKNFMDFNGAVWVNGTVSATCPGADPNCLQSFCGIFYNDQLSVPVLNVILIQTSWKEVGPSAAAWP